MSTLKSPESAGWLERVGTWAGGYYWHLVADEPPENRAPIRVLGAAVIVAAVIAAANWATAGFVLAPDPIAGKVAAAALACMAALAFVLVLDRGTIFLADIMPKARTYALWLWMLLRMAFTVSISGVTAQATIPLIFWSDLSAQGLHMQEESEAGRIKELNHQFDIPEKQRLAKEAADETARLQEQAKFLPVGIQNHLIDAAHCWAAYRVKRDLVPQSPETTKWLTYASARCAAKQAAAQAERAAYEKKMQAAVLDAEQRKTAAGSSTNNAIAEVETRVRQAGEIERQAYNPWSTAVLENLLASNPLAKARWLSIIFCLVLSELLPLLMKIIIGKSAMGVRTSTDRAVDELRQDERLSVAQHDTALARGVGDAMQHAMLAACANPEVIKFCSSLFSAKIGALAPFEVLRVMLHEIETQQIDLNNFVRRHPKFAAAIAETSSQALREMVELFKTSSRKFDAWFSSPSANSDSAAYNADAA